MTTQEFSNYFDTLLDSYSKQANFGEVKAQGEITLDEYEKSLFLTKAQEDIMKEYYSGKNTFGEAFELTEEVRRYLSNLIQTAQLDPVADSPEGTTLFDNSIVFSLPENLWFITYESGVLGATGTCFANKVIKIVPTTQDELSNVMENPFRGPSKRRGLRLDLSGNKVEIVSKYPISKYIVRYLTKLNPIVLVNLPSGLSIDGKSTVQECNLHPALHKVILDRAVRLALMSKLPSETTGTK